jgi:hypothetical protein
VVYYCPGFIKAKRARSRRPGKKSEYFLEYTASRNGRYKTADLCAGSGGGRRSSKILDGVGEDLVIAYEGLDVIGCHESGYEQTDLMDRSRDTAGRDEITDLEWAQN